LSKRFNPYSTKDKRAFWRHGVASVAPFQLDPMDPPAFQIAPATKVATAGSCFAQHISRRLSTSGYTYYVVEKGDAALVPAEAASRNFGTFSARYGNIYTARQLLQLFDRAYGAFDPQEKVWQREDGRFVDPFRSQVEPAGFVSAEEVFAETEKHLAAVRTMFETLDIFVFTLGLTEGWRVKADQAVLPLAPGVAGGDWDETRYEFVNFEVEEIAGDMIAFLDRLRRVNPNAKAILTVSPVPLVATYEDRHVLVSNTYSKSVLRVAADKIARAREGVSYFPSFEIITSNATAHRYFDADLRSVNELGVGHVMRVFFKHFMPGAAAVVQAENAVSWSLAKEFSEASKVVCDEEAIDAGD
jgi:GSCFA family